MKNFDIDKDVSRRIWAFFVAYLALLVLNEFSNGEKMKYSEELQRRTIIN